jgi:hypothetical protein
MDDMKAFADAVADAIETATAPLRARIAVLEKRALVHGRDGRDGKDAPPVDLDALAVKAAALIPMPKDGAAGKDGKDAATVDVEVIAAKAAALVQAPSAGRDGKDGKDGVSVDMAVVTKAITEAVAALPRPVDGKDGRDVDPAMLETIVASYVTKAVSALPVPKDGADGGRGSDGKDGRDGHDGVSVTVDDVAPLIAAEVTKAVAAIPKAIDGVGLSDAVISRDGELVLTFTDGRTKTVGVVVGAGADPVEVERLITKMVDAIPRPKDGKDGAPGADGLGFDDFDVVWDAEKGALIRFSQGERVKEFVWPVPRDGGVYRPGNLYRKGVMVTAQGSLWSAQEDTRERPGDGSKAWRLAVKRGRDGRDRTGGSE